MNIAKVPNPKPPYSLGLHNFFELAQCKDFLYPLGLLQINLLNNLSKLVWTLKRLLNDWMSCNGIELSMLLTRVILPPNDKYVFSQYNLFTFEL